MFANNEAQFKRIYRVKEVMHGPKIHICILGGFVSHQLLFGLTDKSSPVNNKSSSDPNCIYNMDACFGCLP